LLVVALTISCRQVPSEVERGVLERFEFEQPQMGVPFRVVLFATDESIATRAATAAFDRVKQLNAIMSDYEPDSELNELSRSAGQGRGVVVSPDLWRVLEESQRLAQQTDGAFDITVGPYVGLWRRARRLRQMPDPQRLDEARSAVGYRHIVLSRRDHTVRLLVPGMKLDLGGIAKGYAVDEAMKILRSHGITRALVGGVGDIAVGDPPPDQLGWRIAISRFDAVNAPIARHVVLRNAAISTSGDAAQRLEIDGRRYSHIVNPQTGVGLTDHSLVTVIARDCTTTDSLATAVSVLGPQKGLALVKRNRGIEARIVRAPEDRIETCESPGFARFYDSAPSIGTSLHR
jgi:thiamine biosynthesis lipoprotein